MTPISCHDDRALISQVPVRFVIDAQLPPALARMISDWGYRADHVKDVGMGAAPDGHIWAYAVDRAAVIVTKDRDFPRMVEAATEAPAIVWVRVENWRKSALLPWFESKVPGMIRQLAAGNRLVELR